MRALSGQRPVLPDAAVHAGEQRHGPRLPEAAGRQHHRRARHPAARAEHVRPAAGRAGPSVGHGHPERVGRRASSVTVDVYNGNPAASRPGRRRSRRRSSASATQAGKVANSSAQSQAVQPGTQVFYGTGASADAQQIAIQFGTPRDSAEHAVARGSRRGADRLDRHRRCPPGIAPPSTGRPRAPSPSARRSSARGPPRARPRPRRRPRRRGRTAAARAARSRWRRTRPTASLACTDQGGS